MNEQKLTNDNNIFQAFVDAWATLFDSMKKQIEESTTKKCFMVDNIVDAEMTKNYFEREGYEVELRPEMSAYRIYIGKKK